MNIKSVLGSVAAVCTTISFLFQVIKIIKTRKTRDVSLAMYSSLTFGTFCWTLYGILFKEFFIYLASGIVLAFISIILILKVGGGMDNGSH